MILSDIAHALGLNAPALPMLLTAALLGGLVRGFTGFGFAMVFVPLATMVVGPVKAIALVWSIDAPFALPLGARAARKAQWPEVVPLLVGVTALLPAGVWLLTRLDPMLMRWIIALLILAAVTTLASGWRYHGRPGLGLSLGVGGLSGLAAGLASIGGMPVALFWLGSQRNDAAQTRHNFIAYLALSTVPSGIVFAWNGVLTLTVFAEALVLLVPYGIGLFLGTHGFHRASELTFRRIAYAVIASAAILSLPLLDPLLR
jgi:uncharacterized membrane protein YfcA